MYKFWDGFILPIVEMIGAKKIIEIGADKGKNTIKLLDYCTKNQSELLSIDPFPQFDYQNLVDQNSDIFTFYKDISLNVLPFMYSFDVVLLDGDHNWYTVYNELKCVEKNASGSFPIVFCHDIGWPYSRRDLYYNPETIPEQFRKPYDRKGIRPNEQSVVESEGFNRSFYNARYEGGLYNGILTAIEDFIKESTFSLRFVNIPGNYGLGILVDENLLNRYPSIVQFFNKISLEPNIREHIEQLDLHYVYSHIDYLNLKQENIDATNKIKKIEVANEDLTKANRDLSERNEDLSKENEDLSKSNEELLKEIEYLRNENKGVTDRVYALLNENKLISAEKEKGIDKISELENKIDVLNAKAAEKEEALSDANKNIKHQNHLYQRQIQHSNSMIHLLNQLVCFWQQKTAFVHFFINLFSFGKTKSKSVLDEIDRQVFIDLCEREAIKNVFTKTINRKGKFKTFFGTFFKKGPKKAVYFLRMYKAFQQSHLFSGHYYMIHNLDIYLQGVNPYIHFIMHGGEENRNPSDHFDTRKYLQSYVDVQQSGLNPLYHFLMWGKKEKRKAFPVIKIHNDKIAHRNKNDNTVKKTENPKSEKTQQLLLPTLIRTFDAKELSECRVSVIMPTWNRRNVIECAIDSVLNQTFKNYELLITDDGSTDGTEDFVKSKYSNEIQNGIIKFFKQEHSGVSRARNTSLKNSTGDYIAYLDSDNKWNKFYLEKMLGAFLRYPEFNCVYADVHVSDKSRGLDFVRNKDYNRKVLLTGNFIDLNIFMNKAYLTDQLGGFNETLKRLVDWEYIMRLTENNTPYHLKEVLVDYFVEESLNNISITVPLDENYEKVKALHLGEYLRLGIEKLNIAYVLWDFPAMSQTFVLGEIKYLINNGYDVKVYFKVKPDKVANLDFWVDSYQVKDSDELSKLLKLHDRNIMHSHFVYPTVTLLTYPASQKTGILFTFIVHAVDIFHYENEKRNKIEEISNSPLCIRVLTISEFHRNYIIDRGVPETKIIVIRQAVEKIDKPKTLINISHTSKPFKVIGVLARFIEKKGILDLIKAFAKLPPSIELRIYGYGPLEDEYRNYIEAHNIKGAKILGSLNDVQAVEKAYSEIDVLAVPCVRASNGDMDGMPTVILEAMLRMIPVVATDVSAISETVIDDYTGFLAEPGDIESLTFNLNKALTMPPKKLEQITKNAYEFISKFVGIGYMVSSLITIWNRDFIDIFLVTHSTDSYNTLFETKEVIRRIFKYTSLPFTLTIVDNGSNAELKKMLHSQMIEHTNIQLITLEENIYCGPASNIALKHTNSNYIFYVCSKEGFIFKYGWEMNFLSSMFKNKNLGLVGCRIHSNKYYDGESYQKQEWFKSARNPEFARSNPKKRFAHVQGGMYVLNREAFIKNGGFNEKLPQGNMDVEYSYYLESNGWELGHIDDLISQTVKTLPPVNAKLSEKTIAVHPLSLNDLEAIEKQISGESFPVCNICGALLIEKEKKEYICQSCNSTSFDRALLRYLADSDLIYRGLKCLYVGIIPEYIKRMFSSENVNDFSELQKCELQNYDFIVYSHLDFNNELIQHLTRECKEGTTVILRDDINVINSKIRRLQYYNKLVCYNELIVEYCL
jgi:glycosyltransferase involved in cell wall biosynthesis/GT2 family glycosyltransferase/FtsZ-binding cell division protein ZapB